MTQRKIQRTSTVVAVITKILYISLIIVVCFELIGYLWHIMSPDSSSFMLGQIRIVSPFIIAENHIIFTELFTGIAGQSFFIAILIITNRIFKDISREYTPFLPKNIKRMKKLAVLLIIDSFIASPIDIAIRQSYSMPKTYSSDLSSEMIVLAVVIYCFALIFQYGVELQQQSDETL